MERRAILFACLAGTGHFLAVYMIQPLVSLYTTALGANPVTVGIIVSSFGFLPMLLSVPAGVMIDRSDVRRVVSVGALLSLVSALAMSVSRDYSLILACQTILGTAHAVSLVATQNYVGALSRPDNRDGNFAFFGSGTSLGMAVAPALAGSLVMLGSNGGDELAGYRIAFATAAVAFVLPLASGVLMPRSPAHSSVGRKELSGSMLAMAQNRGMQVVLLATVVHVAALTASTSFYPVFLSGLGFMPAAIGVALTVRSLASLVVRPFAGVLVRFIPRQHLFVACMAVLTLTWMAVPLVTTWWLQAVIMALAGAAAGLIYPLILVLTTSSCPEGTLGLAMGFRFAVNRMVAVVSPAALGLAVQHSGMLRAFEGFGLALAGITLATALLLQQRARVRST
jgi:MFS family permease